MQEGDFSRESELQNLLADERLRCNQYKQIYQALKEEHTKAQEELTVIHHQLKNAREQSDLAMSSKDTYIKKLESTLAEKQEEVASLTQKVSSFDREEIRRKVQSEERKRFEELLSNNDAEIDELRERYNNSHYDNTMLKSKLEFSEKEHERAIELLKVQHLAETSSLRATIESLKSENKTPVKDYLAEFRASEKAAMQLTSRLNVMRAECEELRAQNTELMGQLETQTHTHAKQLGDHIANVKSVESAKEHLMQQNEVLRNEVSKLKQEKSALRDEIQKQKQEILTLKNQLEECQHKYSIETTNLNIALQECKTECEIAKEHMKDETAHLNAELCRLNELIAVDRRTLREKEEGLERNLSFFKQQMYQKLSDKDQALAKAEFKLKELEISKNEELSQIKQQLKSASQKVLSVMQEKSEVEKEIALLRSEFEAEAKRNDNKLLEDLLNQNSELHSQIQSLKENVHELLLRDAEHQQNEREKLKHSEDHESANTYHELAKLQLTLEQQKYQYQQRIDCLQNQIKDQQNEWFSEKKDMQAKLKQYARLITKLREKLDAQRVELDELKIQNDLLKENAPANDHEQLKEKLADLIQKQGEFHQVMVAAFPRLPDSKSFLDTVEEDQVSSKAFSRATRPFSSAQDTLYRVSGTERRSDVSLNSEELKLIGEKPSLSKRKLYRKRRELSRQLDFHSSSDIDI